LRRSSGGDHFFFLEPHQHSFSSRYVSLFCPSFYLLFIPLRLTPWPPIFLLWERQGRGEIKDRGTGWEAARGAARATVGEVRAPMPFPRGAMARWPTSVWRGMHWRRYLRPPLAGRLRRSKFATNLPSCAARLRSTAYQPSMGMIFCLRPARPPSVSPSLPPFFLAAAPSSPLQIGHITL
jgi:hypothetical protein